ncbi:unnamed protein product [Adineta ricciae]|uniref:Apple domain-containing protein n=1 Tax=Adineta ricciae TaxID=249248 RepID=A0A815IU02_ADIRI|nr:unnamed protein product [Adineta ricciae]
MFAVRGRKFQCATTTCSPFVNTVTPTIIKCEMTCLAQVYCRAASFHQSNSNCELFTDMSNEIGNMLTDLDIITTIVIAGTRSPPEPATTTTSTATTSTITTTIRGNGNSYTKSFYFNNNHIKSIPSEISQINNLFTLNVAHNDLTNIPKELFDSKTLRNLDVTHNLFPSTILHDIDDKFKVNKATFTYSI